MKIKTCTIQECEKRYYGRGMCSLHYRRWRKTAPPDTLRKPSVEDRFWSKVQKGKGCWEWKASRLVFGHGQFSVNGKSVPAHRVSYEFAHGPIPPGLVIDHICHNPPCVNPAHLRAVSQKQNIENQLGAHKGSTTGVRGVRRNPNGRYRASLKHHGVNIEVGIFDSLEAAEAAVIARRNELFTCNDVDRLATR